jgi:hypothetical protein
MPMPAICKRPMESLTRLLAVVSLSISASMDRTALAQDAWVFVTAIPCSSAPVYGLPFNQCWVSNTRTFRNGTVQSWKLTYNDLKSEVAVGLYKLVEPRAAGGLGAVAGSRMIGWLQEAEALKTLTSGGSNWALGPANYVTYQKGQRRCVGFVRNGPSAGGQVNWILGGAFCRESDQPLAASEAQFIADAVKVRE